MRDKEKQRQYNKESYHRNRNKPDYKRKRKEYAQRYYQENKEKVREYSKKHHEENRGRISALRKVQRSTPKAIKSRSDYNTAFRVALKKEVLIHYSNCGDAVCNECGETRLSCLSLDHINNDGNKAGRRGYNFYLWLKRNSFPDIGLQPLCMNCQFVKRAFYEEEQRQLRIQRRIDEH